MSIRPATPNDTQAISNLLGATVRNIEELTTPRLYPRSGIAHERCFVHATAGTVDAIVAAAVLPEGDAVTPGNSAHITIARAAPSVERRVLTTLIGTVVHDLEGSGVSHVSAGNSMLTCGLHNPPTGTLSSTHHSVVCAALEDAFFDPHVTSLELKRDVRDAEAPTIPTSVSIEAATTNVMGEAAGLSPGHNNLAFRLLVGGVVSGWCGAFHSHAFHPTANPSLYVHYLMVPSFARRRGNATLLLRHVFHEARNAGIEAVYLGTRSTNYAAQAFYQRLGFGLSDVSIEFAYRGPRLVDAARDAKSDLSPYFDADNEPTPAAAFGTFGAFVRTVDDPVTQALAEAATHDNASGIRQLLDLGANVNAEREDGSTALHAAAWEGNVSAVRALLAAGADPRVRDRPHGATPREWADFAGRDQAAALLQDAEAPRDTN